MERIGRYDILGEVGRGGMGVVYRGTDPTIGRSVAIKVIRLQDADNPQEEQFLRERLFREASSAGVLSHPGIVTIYEIAEQGGMAYIAMEFVNGTTLEKVLLADVPPKKETIFRVVKQTASALDFAHRKGIVHRDIKPANIMIDEDGTVKICDFGVAKIFASQKTATQTGLVMGSPSYLSPEQIQGRPVDGRSDQFSLAVVTFRMFTGLRPFQGDTLTTLMYKIVYEPPPPIDQLNPTVGPGIKSVLEKALAKDPASRFALCSDFAEALLAACDEDPSWQVAAGAPEEASEESRSEPPAADPLPSGLGAVRVKEDGKERLLTAPQASVAGVEPAQLGRVAGVQQTGIPAIAPARSEQPVLKFPYWVVGLIGLVLLVAVILAVVYRKPQAPIAATPASTAPAPPPHKVPATPIPQVAPLTEVPAAIPPKIDTSTLPEATTGSQYSTLLDASGGSKPYAWSVMGQLPPGLDLNTAAGTIHGKPRSIGIFAFTVRISDGDGRTAEKSLRLQVKPEEITPKRAGPPIVEPVPRVAPVPLIASFEAVPSSVAACKIAILRWTVTGATSVSIAPGVGAVNPSSGYKVVRPLQTTQYTLEAKGAGGSSARREVTLAVSAPATSPCGPD